MTNLVAFDILKVIVTFTINTQHSIVPITLFLCDLYEISCSWPCQTSALPSSLQCCESVLNLPSNLGIKQLIKSIFQHLSSVSSMALSKIRNNLIEKRSYICLSLFIPINASPSSSFKEQDDTIITNTFMNCTEMLVDFVQLLMSSKQQSNEQIWLKKIIQFIENRNFEQLTMISDNLLSYNSINNYQSIILKLSQQIVTVLKLKEMESLVKLSQYLTNTTTNDTSNNRIFKQKVFLLFSNLRAIHQCLCELVNLWSKIYELFPSASSNNEQNSPLNVLQFCEASILSFDSNLKTNELLEPHLKCLSTNIKLQTVLLLKSLIKKSIVINGINDLVCKLFSLLIGDVNNCIVVDCAYQVLVCKDIDPSNGTLLTKIMRGKSQQVKDMFAIYCRQQHDNEEDETLMIELLKRRHRLIIERIERFKSLDLITQNVPSQTNDNQSFSLDDTLNVISTAMDTTISMTDSQTVNLNQLNKMNSFVDVIEKNLNLLFDVSDQQQQQQHVLSVKIPETIRQRLENITQIILEKI
jgi:hypothetical protein